MKNLSTSALKSGKALTFTLQISLFVIVLLSSFSEKAFSQTFTYSESFTSGSPPSAQAQTNWTAFRSQLTTRTYNSVTMNGSLNTTGITITDPVVATAIASALNTGTAGNWTSGGNTWYVGDCSGVEISANGGSICTCSSTYAFRPSRNDYQWGGVGGTTCSSASQTMTLFFVAGLPGDNCSNAQDLSALASPYSGTTAGYANDISTCRTSGPDRIWYINVPNNYTITVDESALGYDAWEYMGYGGSCPGTTQITCWDNDALAANTWTNATGSTQTVWYILDSYSGGSGTFSFDWSLTQNSVTPGTPTSLSASPTGATTATISWAAGSPVGVPAPTYYWVVKNTGGTTITSGNTASTSASVTGLSANTTYYFTVYSNNSAGTSGTATSSNFTTYPAIPTSISGTTTICNGSSTTLTANGNQGTVYWYTVSCGGTATSPATGNTLTVSPSTTTTYYARNYNGNWSAGCASATVTVTANLSSVSLSPSNAQSICVAGSGSQLTASETGGGTITGRQWGKRSSSGGAITPISGATSATFTPTATNLGGAGIWYVVCTSTPTCGSATVSNEVTVTVSPTSVGGTATAASSSLCSGSSTTVTISGYTGTIQWQQSANGSTGWGNVSGGSGATTATYTTPNLSSTTYYKAVITSGACSAASSATASVTVNALPTVAAITGTTTVCTQFTTTLSNATPGGTWSSGSTGVATINSSGVVTGVLAGTSLITYSVTNGNGCTNTATTTVTVNTSLAAPTSVTATPSTIQTGQSSNLSATSAGNSIFWYTAATGGTSVGSSASGANFSVSPTVTSTYYAEANSTQSFYINTLTANNSYVTDHNSITGDDRGGIAVTSFYYYYTGDGYTVRYNMPGLTSPVSCTRRDGLFSDLGTGTLYTLWNGSSDPVYGTNTSPYNVTSFKTMNTDLTMGSTTITLSSAISMSQGSSAIYAGANFVILQSGNVFYRVDIPSGTVTNLGTYSISRYGSESWATWGVAELNAGVYSVLYRENSNQLIRRLNLSTGAVTTLAIFSNLSDMCSFTYSPWHNRWYFHYEGSSQFGGSAETAGYADGTHTTSSTGCPSATRSPVTVTISNPPTVTTATITNINAITATGGGNVTVEGGSAVSVRGVCWSTGQNPTNSNSKTTDGSGTGAFSSSITSLAAGTLYYVRAYATNSQGTSYGDQVSFTSYSPGVIAGSQAICSGANPSLFTSSSAAIGMPDVTYQWQSSADNSTFGDISGATSLTYQSGAISSITYFRRNATSGSVTLSSNVITVSISAGISAPTSVTATPATILSGASSNLNATVTAGNEIKWYTAATEGTLLATVGSGVNYSVSPTTSTTYYAQGSPVSCTENTLANVLSNLNTNFTNITSQIPSPYNFTLDPGVNSNYINDGGNDMYDGGNYVSTNNNSSFYYSDNTILTSTIFGTGGKYFTRKVNNLFVLAADMASVSWFKVNGNYGSDGGGSTSSGTFTITVGCKSFNCFLSRVYNAGDPSINELFIIPANASASHTPIANTSDSYHTLNGITASTRMYYLLYAGSNGGFIDNSSAQNIATAFLTQTLAVITGSGECPSATRTPVTVTVSGPPTVTTDAISAIAATTATGGGNVTADGGSTVSARGVCWNTAQNPTTSNFKTTNGTGTGTFTSSITGLATGSTYYVRAYATNAMGTSYGSQVSFATFQLGAFPNINKTYGDPPFVLVNPTSGSPGSFSYTSSNTDVATIAGNTVTIVGAGSSTITATQAASGGYGSASTTATLAVAKANQVLSLTIPTSAPLNTFIGTSLPVTATSSAGLPVTVEIGAASTATATLNGTIGNYSLTNVSSAGTLVIVATQAGNTNYNSSTTSQSFIVTLGNQSITFDALTPLTFTPGLTTDLSATASSGLGVTFSVISGQATISGGNHLSISGAGVVVIQASQAGNSSWNAAPDVSQNLTINKATPVIANFDDITKSYGDIPFTLNPSSASTGAFSFTSSNTGVATVSGNTVTIVGVGSSTLTANQAADANYIAASTTAILNVGKANQTITLDAIDDTYLIDFINSPIQVTASASSGLTVSLSLQAGSVATLNGSQLESTDATGSVTVIASQGGNAYYNAASNANESFSVTKANQTITFDALPVKHIGDPDFDLTASSTSNLLISYANTNPAVVTINNKTVTIAGIGTTNITASQAGNIYYNAASGVMRQQEVQAEEFYTWTGAVSTAWDVAGNWSSSTVPSAADNVIIPASPAHLAHVNKAVGTPALCNKLTIESGAVLTIDAAKALTVSGTFTNSGNLLIVSSAAGSGSLITNGSISNSGSIDIQRYISTTLWHLISSPISNATANIFYGDYMQNWSEPEAKWTDILDAATALIPVEGYGLWTSKPSAYTYIFSGTPNTGALSKALTYTEVPGLENDGANLLGNPYPSSIDWSGLDDTYGATYFWNGSGYDSWNDGSGSGSRYIPSMQGFFIVANSAGTFSLGNSNRVHSDAAYYKTVEETTEYSIVLKTVSQNYTDKLFIRFDNEASEGFDLQHDAYKFLSNTLGISQLYSVAADKKLSIDVRPPCEVIQLGFINDQSGEYQIGLNAINGISEVALEDTKTNVFTDLLVSDYKFDYSSGELEQRFKLHFGPLSVTETANSLADIYSYKKEVFVNLHNNDKGDIYIYNISGQLVATVPSAIGSNRINLLNTGNYIVKVVTEKSIIVRKLFIQ